jgi:hypothetical protein
MENECIGHNLHWRDKRVMLMGLMLILYNKIFFEKLHLKNNNSKLHSIKHFKEIHQ